MIGMALKPSWERLGNTPGYMDERGPRNHARNTSSPLARTTIAVYSAVMRWIVRTITTETTAGRMMSKTDTMIAKRMPAGRRGRS